MSLACGVVLALLVHPSSGFAQHGVQVNTDANGNNKTGDAANEPSIAVSLTNPLEIVVGWREFPSINSDTRKAGYGYSHDGGLTWTNGGVLAPPPGWSQSTQQTDPCLGANSSGTFFYWSEPFVPQAAQWVYPSYNGGVTWQTPAPAESPTNGDKDWMVIDTTGGVGDGHIYGGWNHFNLGGQCFVRSTDHGASFSSPVRIADAGGTQWMLHFAVDPDGDVYAAWRNMSRNAIYVTKSTNAKNAGVTPTFDAFGSGGYKGLDIKIDNGNDPGFLGINPVGFHQIYLGIDHSDGPRRGWVYCLWADNRRDGSDIHFARSSDGGFTWVNGIRINDDPPGTFQWMPAMSVAPDGRIDACWYDTRNHTGTYPESELFYSFSLDGGDTWSVCRRISDSFSTRIGWPVQQKIGDYIDSRSDAESMMIAYAATYTGGQDVYFMRVAPTILTVDNLVAGQNAHIAVTGAVPNQVIWLAASTSGAGSTYVSQLKVYLGLDQPFQVGKQVKADANGNASWDVFVPNGGKGRTVWFQAVQSENGSNMVSGVIQ